MNNSSRIHNPRFQTNPECSEKIVLLVLFLTLAVLALIGMTVVICWLQRKLYQVCLFY